MTPLMYLLLLFSSFIGMILFTRWARVWGSTREDQRKELPGDAHLISASNPVVRMTRAINIHAEPTVVWHWMAQMGRGAGWYSYDLIDNGATSSARHVVSWIPDPQPGDTSAIGRLTTVLPKQSLVWWADSVSIPFGEFRCVFDLLLLPQDSHSRLIIRISADATGPFAWPILHTFSFLDSIMARKQLLSFKYCAERYGDRRQNPSSPESGAKDQYQLAACIYASGETAGKWGHSLARKWAKNRRDDA